MTFIVKESRISKFIEKIGFIIAKIGFWIAGYKNFSVAKPYEKEKIS